MVGNHYQTVINLRDAILRGDHSLARLTTAKCKGELFIGEMSEDGETFLGHLFSAYYGTNNACNDVCLLLGLPEPEEL